MVPDLPVLPLAAGGAAVVVALAVLAALEIRSPLRPRREPWLRHVVRNASTFLLAQALSAPLRFVAVAPLAAHVREEGWGLLGWVDAPRALEVALGLLLLDGTMWLWHLFSHRVPLLWRFHAVHHADLDVDASTALRFHFGELALSVGWRAAQVALIGVGPGLLAAWELATALAAAFHHSNLDLPERADRALAWLIPTPRYHGRHHSVVTSERNSNYGVILTAWDRAFGTLCPMTSQDGLVIGLEGLQDPESVRFGRMQLLPFGGRERGREPVPSGPDPRMPNILRDESGRTPPAGGRDGDARP